MSTNERVYFLDNLRTFLIFLVVVVHAGVVYESSGFFRPSSSSIVCIFCFGNSGFQSPSSE